MIRNWQIRLGCLLALSAGPAFAAPPAKVPHHASPEPAAAPAASVATPAEASSIANATSDIPSLEEIQTFTRAFELIKQAYVAPVGNRQLMDSAIRGMLAGLDPHSDFLDVRDLKDLTEDTSGAYSGLGIEVAQVKHQLVIVAPLDGGPAKAAGIQPGDVIEAIDGVPVQPDAIDAAITKLRGPIGSRITLSILHPDGSKPVKVPLVRQRIRIASVHARMLAPGFAYVRISEFQEDTADELTDELEKLQKEHGPLRGAVLDLRSNPGGLLTAAVAVSDDLLDAGTIVTTRGRLADANLSFSAHPGDLLNGAPLVVLVDNGTASAAEIVSGALKDNHRALIIGKRTFGKGVVQTVLPLDAEHAVKITTARYYTPSGTSIQAEGIKPDIALADLTVNKADSGPQLITSEADLSHHLANEDGNAPKDINNDGSAENAKLATQDYALSQALNVLKGLALNRPAAVPAKR